MLLQPASSLTCPLAPLPSQPDEPASFAEGSTGWCAHVRRVAPRNRPPPGRSHHSVVLHGAGRSLLVFGGYASGRGCLGELWAFHMDHLEWWQPHTTGGWESPCDMCGNW